jgi:hypothetical protein
MYDVKLFKIKALNFTKYLTFFYVLKDFKPELQNFLDPGLAKP